MTINILFIIAAAITVIGATIAAIKVITKKQKARSEKGKSERAAKNILDSYKDNSKII